MSEGIRLKGEPNDITGTILSSPQHGPEERHWQTLRRDSYGNNVAVILLRITRPLPLDQDLDHVSG
jgi:hypothetical protein